VRAKRARATAPPAPDAMEKACPFPGPASYDYEGRGSFFGREQETVALASMLLGRQLTVLTAGSGDGKTSLLHAGVIPILYEDGIEAAVTEPGGTAPIQAIGGMILDRLLPSKVKGKALLDRLIETLGPGATLLAAREHCDTLTREARQKLLLGQEARRPVNLLEGGALVTWLRDGRLSALHLEAAMNASASLDGRRWPGVMASLSDLLHFFDGPDALPPLDLDETPDAATEQLLEAMEAAIGLRLSTNPDFEFVLVIDQFEEIFVQFHGRRGSDGPTVERWRHREALVDFIRKVRARNWPVRIVLSLRKEHYADLQTHLGDRAGLAPLTYHLGPLTKAQAEECLLRDNIWRQEAPTPDQAGAIVDGLRVEDQYVHPTLLSVVGEWLWRQDNLASLTREALREASGRAIDAFVERALETAQARFDWTGAERQEALEILSQLIVVDNDQARRLSVAESTLINAQFRDPRLRERLIRELQSRRLVRFEYRLGGYYVEIVHERLIEAIHAYLDRTRRENEAYAALSKLVEDIRAEARRPACTRLEPNDRNILLANFERLSLPGVIAARTVARLLLDPTLPRIAQTGPQAEDHAIYMASRLRLAIRSLAASADLDDVALLPGDPEARMSEGLFASPGEVEQRLAARSDRAGSAALRLMLASTILHRDPHAHRRIRAVARRLTRRATA
jgi:hypothetical protein